MPHTEAFLDPSSLAPRPSYTIPNGGTFSVLGHTFINAPPQAVYDAMLDVSRYGEWNTFVKKAVLYKPAAGQSDRNRMATGAHMKFMVDMGDATPNTSPELVTCVEPLKTAQVDGTGDSGSGDDEKPTTNVRWVWDNSAAYTPGFVLKSEHMNEIIDLGDGRTELIHWETFAGLAATFVKSRYGEHLRKKFNAWGDELKVYLEGKVTKKETND